MIFEPASRMAMPLNVMLSGIIPGLAAWVMSCPLQSKQEHARIVAAVILPCSD